MFYYLSIALLLGCCAVMAHAGLIVRQKSDAHDRLAVILLALAMASFFTDVYLHNGC